MPVMLSFQCNLHFFAIIISKGINCWTEMCISFINRSGYLKPKNVFFFLQTHCVNIIPFFIFEIVYNISLFRRTLLSYEKWDEKFGQLEEGWRCTSKQTNKWSQKNMKNLCMVRNVFYQYTVLKQIYTYNDCTWKWMFNGKKAERQVVKWVTLNLSNLSVTCCCPLSY